MGKFARKKIRFIVQFLLAFLLALPIVLSGSIAPQTATALNNGLSPTPPIGASTNHGCGVRLQVICGGRRTISSTTGIE
ncbi:hypothetical protein [Paenibacillus sp. Root444D2]|uniref:hypothetical protein n=1 Tax=Paenibacillus sp. Root444D2 TaxID=1736538 RepID=UPI0012E3ABA1|nr:hypothetical protein [Paenibacillus sp. Root444D2]